jgi:hypothetical protein
MGADADPADTFRDLEEQLCRIPDVTAARVVPDEFGRPAEVHILASPAKHAKQIVRDVQSVAIASFGLDLDRRIISVAQLRLAADAAGQAARGHEDAPPLVEAVREPGTFRPPATLGRIRLDGVTALMAGTRCTAQVVLRRGEHTVVGAAEGVGVSGAPSRLVAEATLSAVSDLEDAAGRCAVEAATIVRVGERSVALATVVFAVPPYEEVVCGAAVVRSAGDHDAVARAVLDATNRRLGHLARD